MNLVAVAPAAIHRQWDAVREGLQAMARKTRTAIPPEHFYLLLKTERAFLYLLDGGFLIVQMEHDFDGPVLVVLALWGRDLAPHCAAILQAVDDLGRRHQCVRVRIQSTRHGWRKFFTETGRIYERQL